MEKFSGFTDGFHHFRIVNAFSVAKANGTGNEQAWIVSLESHANHISGKPPSKDRGVGFNLRPSDRLIIRLLLFKTRPFSWKMMKTETVFNPGNKSKDFFKFSFDYLQISFARIF